MKNVFDSNQVVKNRDKNKKDGYIVIEKLINLNKKDRRRLIHEAHALKTLRILSNT